MDLRDDDGERRHLTIMFCDLVDSTPIAGRLDPEDLRDLVHQYHHMAESSITRYGGRVAQYLGDGVLAYFGYPSAHEDDARRAVIAALDIVGRIGELPAHELAARVAVHTGPVVVGAAQGGGAPELTGLALNVAARLQAVTEPNSVVLSQATADLVPGYFDLVPLGALALKGVDEPVAAYRAQGSHGDLTRFDLAAARGLTPFVARDDQVHFLQDRWRAVTQGRFAAVLLLGDPGIGKSRLVWEFRQSLNGAPHDAAELHCSELHSNTLLHPVVQLLQARLGDAAGSTASPSAALVSLLAGVGVPLQPGLSLIAGLLGIADPGEQPDLPQGVDMRRAMLLDHLRDLLVGSPDDVPLLLVVEDVQWADPTTVELVGLLLEHLSSDRQRRVLLLCTARSGFSSPWPRERVEQLELERLDDESARELVGWLTRQRSLPLDESIVATIVERSDGVPLFLEEVAVLVTTQAPGVDQASVTVPTSLLDLLVSRIDRLGAAKPVVQAAALIGRDFDADLLAAVLQAEPSVTMAALDLPDVAYVVSRVPPSGTSFSFRHALVRDAAYSTLLLRQRRRLHARVGRELIDDENRDPPRYGMTPDVVAYHCRQGGLLPEAVEHLHLAAARSVSSGANAEAVAFVDEALSLLQSTSATPEAATTELGLLTLKGPALMAQLGYAHASVAATFHRAKELLDELGDRLELFPVLYGLVAYSAVRCELDTASELAGRLRHFAEQAGDDGLTTLAHAASAQVDFIRGRFGQAAEHAAVCVAHHDPVTQADHRFVFGEDPGTICQGVSCWLAWLRGDVATATSSIAATVEAARALDHAFTLAETLVIAARLHHYRKDIHGVREAAEEALGIATRHGFPIFRAEAAVWCGWADAMEHGDSRGLERLRDGLRVFEKSGWESPRAHNLTLLGEAEWRLGDGDAALDALTAARRHALRYGDLDHLVEALRLSATVVSAHLRAPGEAWQLLDEAARLAAEQQARSFALRVAVTRAELTRQVGDGAGLEHALAEVAARLAELPAGASSPELDHAAALARSH